MVCNTFQVSLTRSGEPGDHCAPRASKSALSCVRPVALHLGYVRGVLRSGAHQNIDFAGVARHAMKRQGKRADDQIINVMRV